MEEKILKIQAPEGYEIDRENSTLDKIVFKKIEKLEPNTYKEVAKLLLYGKTGYFTDANGDVVKVSNLGNSCERPNTALTEEQLEWLMALNKLKNVSVYLNEGWVPDWMDEYTEKYFLRYDIELNEIQTDYCYRQNIGRVQFKSRELAMKAIEILGEGTVKTALGVYLKN